MKLLRLYRYLHKEINVSVRFSKKRFARMIYHSDYHGLVSKIIPTYRFRRMNHAVVIEGGIKKSIFFCGFHSFYAADGISRVGKVTYGREAFLRPVLKLLQQSTTTFVRGGLLKEGEQYWDAYIAPEKAFFAPCLFFPMSNKHPAQLVALDANDFYEEERFAASPNGFINRGWNVYVNEKAEGAEAKKRRDADLFWVKMKYA